jgi:hypothetical protein
MLQVASRFFASGEQLSRTVDRLRNEVFNLHPARPQ